MFITRGMTKEVEGEYKTPGTKDKKSKCLQLLGSRKLMIAKSLGMDERTKVVCYQSIDQSIN